MKTVLALATLMNGDAGAYQESNSFEILMCTSPIVLTTHKGIRGLNMSALKIAIHGYSWGIKDH